MIVRVSARSQANGSADGYLCAQLGRGRTDGYQESASYVWD